MIDHHKSGGREFISVSDIIGFLQRYLRFIAMWVVMGVLVALFYNATTDRLFTASTSILIEPKISQLVQQQAAEVNLSLDTAQIESQIAVMQSEKIAAMVIDELKLMDDLVFNRSRSPSITGRFLKLKAMIDGKPLNEPDSDSQARLSPFERSRRTMSVFYEGLSIRRLGVSYALEISFRSADPETAAKIANAIADAFVREQVETKAAAAREGGAWLEKRLRELRTQMNAATQEAQEFRSRHDYTVGGPPDPAEADGQFDGDVSGDASLAGPTLEELEVTADTYRKMYESFLHAYTNSVSQQSYAVADARVITAATTPLYPSAPRPKLVLAFGALGGIMVGIGLAFLRHTLDQTVRSARQIREDLGLQCLGELPPLGNKKKKAAFLDEVEQSPESRFALSLRKVKAAIGLADTVHPIRYLGIISTEGGMAKSSLASNLATLYAIGGMRTLVVDCDVDTAFLTARLLPAGGTRDGPRSYSDPIAKHITPARSRSFDILSAAASDATKLRLLKRMTAFIAEIQHYDIVIVDLPSMTVGIDRFPASSALDGVIVVTEWGKTPVDVLGELVRSLHANKTRIIGVVMTSIPGASRKRKA
jgi:uncharacterized protein involved in exopolysaccharide biosynthesis/Mrp family chromosome partitioning ATPase